MSLRFRLEGERGKRFATIDDTHHLFWRLVKEGNVTDTCCLRFIDPYGHTIFNRLQIPQLIIELEDLHKFIKSVEQREILSSIEELARRCIQEPHLYIKIYGD